MDWVHAGATFFRGSALAIAGRTQEGIAQMRQGISKWDASGGAAAPATLPFLFAALAEALRDQGNRTDGLAAVAEGLARTAQTGARVSEAELLRVKGELTMLDPPDEAEAERCFRTAIEIARGQSARWWELRAATSLARLLKRQGKIAEAHKMLSDVYGWFTEGFEFADLQDAKAFLDEIEAKL
jgi:hypothetical protein